AWATLLGEWHAESVKQREGLHITRCGSRDRYVQAADLANGVVVDLGKDGLLFDAHRVVAAPVERTRVQPPEIADPGDRDRHQPVEELVAALASQRHGD